MGYASRDKKPLKDIAIIDPETIGEIAELVVDNLPPGGYEHPATHPATMITEDSAHTFVTLTQKNSIHAQGSDNQDLSGLQPKETGKGLYPDTDALKLSGIEAGANNYSHPTSHAASIITQDASNRFVSDTEKGTWNGKEPGNSNIQTHVTSVHAPSNAQKNSDITKAEIETKLIGELTSHSHAGGGGGLSQQQIEGII